ncbi:MAG: hypothetical protein U0326_10115 [Polyangiales bacterium]
MSEYQFYEFVAIEQRLSSTDIDALRRITSRAEITPTRLQNTYHFGDFKGDPDALMARYFDAMVYVANWGTHTLRLRVPRAAVDVATFEKYRADRGVEVRKTKTHAIVTLSAYDESGEAWDDDGGERWLSELLPLRDELIRGDLRALYLGWLGAVLQGDVGCDAREPSVPARLGRLTAAQKALAAFLGLDDDLIAAAAKGSGLGASSAEPPSKAEFSKWVATLPAKEKDRMLVTAAFDSDARVGAALFQRYRKAQPRASTEGAPRRRTVRELLAGAGFEDDE